MNPTCCGAGRVGDVDDERAAAPTGRLVPGVEVREVLVDREIGDLAREHGVALGAGRPQLCRGVQLQLADEVDVAARGRKMLVRPVVLQRAEVALRRERAALAEQAARGRRARDGASRDRCPVLGHRALNARLAVRKSTARTREQHRDGHAQRRDSKNPRSRHSSSPCVWFVFRHSPQSTEFRASLQNSAIRARYLRGDLDHRGWAATTRPTPGCVLRPIGAAPGASRASRHA